MNTPTTGDPRPNSDQNPRTPKEIAWEKLERLGVLIENAQGVVIMLSCDSSGSHFSCSQHTIARALGAAETLLDMCEETHAELCQALRGLDDKQP